METKQVIVVRKDLQMRKGKMIAQGSHAVMEILLKPLRDNIEYGTPEFDNLKNEDLVLNMTVKKDTPLHNWLTGKFKKIALSVNSEDELIEIYNNAKEKNIPASLILDSGLTEFGGVPTYTAVAIGPEEEDLVNTITENLKLL